MYSKLTWEEHIKMENLKRLGSLQMPNVKNYHFWLKTAIWNIKHGYGFSRSHPILVDML